MFEAYLTLTKNPIDNDSVTILGKKFIFKENECEIKFVSINKELLITAYNLIKMIESSDLKNLHVELIPCLDKKNNLIAKIRLVLRIIPQNIFFENLTNADSIFNY
jgi:hypothetical protein